MLKAMFVSIGAAIAWLFTRGTIAAWLILSGWLLFAAVLLTLGEIERSAAHREAFMPPVETSPGTYALAPAHIAGWPFLLAYVLVSLRVWSRHADRFHWGLVVVPGTFLILCALFPALLGFPAKAMWGSAAGANVFAFSSAAGSLVAYFASLAFLNNLGRSPEPLPRGRLVARGGGR